jgi:hypothetical protein
MRSWVFAVLLLVPFPGLALSNEAQEFMKISGELETVQCEKRKLRRELALAEVEGREADVRTLRERFAGLDRDPQTAKLERRLAELQPRLERSSDPEDLRAVNRQRVEAFYRCG